MDFKPLIEKALGELTMIIDTEADENAFQQWFEDNQIVFRCLGYTKVIPHPRLDSAAEDAGMYVPDFMAMNSAGIWEVVEIKPAKAPIIKDTDRRHSLRSSTESYLSQCAEYSNLFMDREYRDRFNKRYGTDCHKTPEVSLIMGRSKGLDRKQLEQILSHRSSPHIAIKTFDDVRGSVYQFIETLYQFPEEMSPGLCVIFSAILLQGDEENYIIDICKSGSKSRIQMYVKDDKINLDVTDKSGSIYSGSTCNDDYQKLINKSASFVIQISNSGEYSSIDLLVDDKLILEARQRSLDFDFTDKLDHVIGSDQSGTFPSNMFFGGLIILQKIPLIEERWILREFLSSAADELGTKFLWEFIGHKFLHTPSHPLLGGITPFSRCIIQEDEDKKPTLRARRDQFGANCQMDP